MNIVNSYTPNQTDDVCTWPILEPLGPHIATVVQHADELQIINSTGRLMHQYAGSLKAKGQFAEAEPLMRRALAESLRVQFFWRLAGLPYTVSDHYLRTMRSELDWTRQAVCSVQLLTHAHSRAERQYSEQHKSENYKLIQEHWTTDQLKFFRKSASKNEKIAENWERAIKCFFPQRSFLQW